MKGIIIHHLLILSSSIFFNSLCLGELNPNVGHVDNPGTTLQCSGAVIMRLTHLFSSGNSFLEDVIINHEKYLLIICFSLVLLASIVIFLGAFVIERSTNNLIFGLLFQIAPFLSFYVLHFVSRVIPEHFFIWFTLSFMVFFIYIIYKRPNFTNKNLFTIFSALMVGFGIATKIYFAVFIFFPFLLIPKLKGKFLFICLSFVFLFYFSLFRS
ncbi:MAG: hypothetical protein HC905_22545 [Bacteroidales bacterium]|nr:hypothetical protein [Bacteroidales bacterium]